MSEKTETRISTALRSMRCAQSYLHEKADHLRGEDQERCVTVAALLSSAIEILSLETEDSFKKENLYGRIYLVNSFPHASQFATDRLLSRDEIMFLERPVDDLYKLRGTSPKTLKKVIFAVRPSAKDIERFENEVQAMGFRVYELRR